MGTKYGDRRDVPQFFDEWKLANVQSVPSLYVVPGLYVPFAQTARAIRTGHLVS